MVVSNILYFHPYLGKWSILTNIFQMGSNHQLVHLFKYVASLSLRAFFPNTVNLPRPPPASANRSSTSWIVCCRTPNASCGEGGLPAEVTKRRCGENLPPLFWGGSTKKKVFVGRIPAPPVTCIYVCMFNYIIVMFSFFRHDKEIECVYHYQLLGFDFLYQQYDGNPFSRKVNIDPDGMTWARYRCTWVSIPC